MVNTPEAIQIKDPLLVIALANGEFREADNVMGKLVDKFYGMSTTLGGFLEGQLIRIHFDNSAQAWESAHLINVVAETAREHIPPEKRVLYRDKTEEEIGLAMMVIGDQIELFKKPMWHEKDATYMAEVLRVIGPGQQELVNHIRSKMTESAFNLSALQIRELSHIILVVHGITRYIDSIVEQ